MSSAASAGPFVDGDQRREAGLLGLWIFIATELMLFGGLFAGIMVYRFSYPEAMRAGAARLDMWLGGLNTAVLLTSSLLVALAVAAARDGRGVACARRLLGAGGLGVLFLAIKAYEYAREYAEGLMPGIGPPFPLDQPESRLFFNIYFATTGLHALHLVLGIAFVAGGAWMVRAGRWPLPARAIRIEGGGIYWHFVDIVWVFLYPVLYLYGR